MKIFEAALEMIGEATRAGRIPLRWEVNAAGLTELAARTDFCSADGRLPIDKRPLLGVPMLLTNDLSDDPRLTLIVEETWRRGQRA